jgi:hypothetical protein
LASGSVEEGTKVERVNGFNNLCNKSFLCGLTEFESVIELAPDIFGGFELRSGASRRRDKGLGFTGDTQGTV